MCDEGEREENKLKQTQDGIKCGHKTTYKTFKYEIEKIFSSPEHETLFISVFYLFSAKKKRGVKKQEIKK